MKICLKCNHENKDTSKFCEECGSKLIEAPKSCPECGTKLNGSPKFCPECGFNVVDNNALNKSAEKTSKTVRQTENVINDTKFGKYDYINEELKPYDLDEAIRYGYTDVAKKMLENEGISEIMFYSIANAHNEEIINLLAFYGCDFNIKDDDGDSVLLKVINNYSIMLNDYRKHYDETGESTYTPGVFSSGDEFETEDDVHNKYLGIIDALIKNGANPECVNEKLFSETALIKACRWSLVKLVSYLVVDCKVDVNFVPKPDAEENYEFYKKQIEECELDSTVTLSDCEEITGDSPLICAIDPDYDSNKKDIYLIVKCLLENGANTDFLSVHYNYITSELDSKTPLSTSLSHEESINIDLIKLLIQYGADYSEYDTEDEKLEELFAIQNEDLRNRLFSIFEINDAQERYEEYCNNNEYIAERLAEAWGVDSDDEDSYEDDSESDDYEEYVDEDEYEDDETTEEKIRKIVDKYLFDINKRHAAYKYAAVNDSEYSQVFQNVRSYIAKDVSQSEIIGFIDTTLFGKGKAGLVFSTSALYENDSVSSFKIPYHRMGRLQSNGKKITFVGTDDCGGGLLKGMDCNVDNIYYNLPALKDCLEEIYAII